MYIGVSVKFRWFVAAMLVSTSMIGAGNGWAQRVTAAESISVCRGQIDNTDDATCLAGCVVKALKVTRAADKPSANGLYAYELYGSLVCPPAVTGRPELINRRLTMQMAQRCKAARDAGVGMTGFRMLPTKIQPEKMQYNGRILTLEGGFQCGAAEGVVNESWLNQFMDRVF